MKRFVLAASLAIASSTAFAEAPGGPNCGWGNMLFDGSSGLPSHVMASLTNGTTGNATFGMTSGTNGCSPDGTLSYGGQRWMGLAAVMDEFSEDVARGDGEALNAVAVMVGIAPQDRDYFAQMTHQNFTTLFPSETVTAEDVARNLNELMQADQRLSQYAS
ncbi:MAG: DUF3015 domain-containing protein [Halopseudomonas sp.]